ncbi:PAS domain S-box-containing protein/diguanylate cyclase (GGDEF) domain-containing protein [Alteromonadaceae bacterium Bs31]|nr:PAS domain S-box-containing protein/diguanylate cyclase (GGDEF) domain-containing protein [Alteromonadaceae bacterium Bs31]
MKITLNSKILAIATAVIIVTIAAVILTSAKLSTRDYEEALESRSTAIAKSLSIQLERLLQLGLHIDDIVGFEEQCNEVVQSYPGIDLAAVLDRDGKVVFHSGKSTPSLKKQFLKSLVEGPGDPVEHKTDGLTWHYASTPAYDQHKKHIASVVVAFPAHLITNKITHTLWIDLLVGLLVLLTGLAVLYLALTRFVTSPLSNLLSTVVNLRKVPLDLSRRASIQTSDELGQLGSAFNQLMDNLQHTTVSKAELQDTLLELQRLSSALTEEKEQAEIILQSIGDAVISVDNRTSVRFLNQAAEHLCDWTFKAAEGLPLQSIFNLFDARNSTPLPDPFEPAFFKNKSISNPVEAVLQRRDGTTIAVDYTASPIHNADGQINGGVLTLRDVSKERGLAQRLSWQATHDALTGLVNRRELISRLEKASKPDTKDLCQHVLCFMDLDRFKVVNDTAGHAAGDRLLAALSATLAETVRGTDTLARVGGDEFALLLKDCPPRQAERIADAMLNTVECFEFEHKDQIFKLGVSIGLAVIDGSSTGEEILAMADTACYMAKEQGRNRVYVYHTGNSEADERRLQPKPVE